MAKKVTNRQDWDFFKELPRYGNILKDRNALINQYYEYMLARTQRMFRYKGIEQPILKNTFSVKRCEQITQTQGYSFLMNVKNAENGYPDGIYCLFGFGGGVADPNGLPTKASITNVALGITGSDLEIGKDVILYPNDSSWIGFDPMFSKYANLLADIDISLRYALINSRIPSIVQGCDTQTKDDINLLYKDIEEGQKIGGVVASNPLFDSIKTSIISDSKSELIKELLEANQFLLGHWFLDIGTQSNFNMKREAINESESGLNQDTLIPFPDDMRHNRNEAWKKVKELGWITEEVKVDFDSSWHKVHDEYEGEGKESNIDQKEKEGETENEVE